MLRSFLLCVSTALISTLPSIGDAAPTWPSSSDELEDIMFLNSGYHARGFSVAVTPCGFSTKSPGRSAAAEWIRTAFHDMSTGSVFTGRGGLDASLMFEISNGENAGDAFNTTLSNLAPFFSTRSSMSDLIALGVYTAVRSCGGPIIPIKTGRVDATAAGAIGVPQPQNAIGTLQNQFLRVGFNTSEMIALTACGHSLGGVHAADFPNIVPVGSFPNDVAPFDTSSIGDTARFDEKVASEYVAGSRANPLVSAQAAASGRDSDRRVFAADSNATITKMADPANFASLCKYTLQKMIEVVPSSVTLTDPITPYEVKPVNLQLTLQDGGSSILFTGEIRVRTTTRGVSSVNVLIKDRSGASGSTITTSLQGTAAGFDDSFSFFSFSQPLSADSSISSFTVQVLFEDSTVELFDNNGAEFPLQDVIFFQRPLSCLSTAVDVDGKRNLTIVAAVRNTVTATPTLQLTLRAPRLLPQNLQVPSLVAVSVSMTQLSSSGVYNLFGASYLAPSDQVASARFDVVGGTESDSFKYSNNLDATCSVWNPEPSASSSSLISSTASVAPVNSSLTIPSTTYSASSSLSTSSELSSDSTQTLTGTLDTLGSSPISSVYTSLATSTSSSVAQPTPSVYSYQGCFTDSVADRALNAMAFVDSSLTISKCGSLCTDFEYFGLEYGSECYCGNARDISSTAAPEADCSMPCSGDSTETCGNGDRLSIYKSLSYTPAVEPSIDDYDYEGCFSDSPAARVLSGPSLEADDLTVEACSTYCNGTTYFGVEYARECYCGDILSLSAEERPESDCAFRCSGNKTQLCGGSSRLNLYVKHATPNIQGWMYEGCTSDTVADRVLIAAAMTDTTNMSYATCASFCSGYVYFGVEYGTECYCGNNISKATTESAEDQCNMPCSGSTDSMCGGSDRMSLFKSGSARAPSDVAISGWQYKGCFTDSTASRSLNASFVYNSTMTVEMCATYCASFQLFGLEYGAECYCGDQLEATGALADDESECWYTCSGDKEELCGAENRMSVYEAL